MTASRTDHLAAFRRLHAPGELLVLPNAWDAATSRLAEACGARAVATTSSGVAWCHGYPDGNALPPRILADAVAGIARVLGVPLTVDAEAGYASDPGAVAETVASIAAAGAVGINLEDGADAPDLLCAKLDAIRETTRRAGLDVFVNVRTDVYLRGLVPPEGALDETLARARRYRAAGADGLFVPYLRDADAIRAVAAATPLPLNVMVVPGLPPVAALRALGVRRVSAGSAIAQRAYAAARRAATEMLIDGRYDAMLEAGVPYPEMNALFRPAT
jgi:2-methylisocitrate lyase-like PEP mutase family enzyme